MTKSEFIGELNKRLKGIPEADLSERIGFYEEIISDGVEEGLSEEEAVARLGSAEAVSEQILCDYPLSKIVKEKVKPKRKLRAWEIVLLAVGSPLWLSVLIVIAAVVLSAFGSVFSVVISLWCCDLCLLLGGLGAIAAGIYMFFTSSDTMGVALIGGGIFAIGISIFLFIGCFYLSKAVFKLCRITVIGIKHLIVGKEEK